MVLSLINSASNEEHLRQLNVRKHRGCLPLPLIFMQYYNNYAQTMLNILSPRVTACFAHNVCMYNRK